MPHSVPSRDDSGPRARAGPLAVRVVAVDLHGVLLSGRANDQDAFAARLGLSAQAWSEVRRAVLVEQDGWSRVERGEATLAEFADLLSAAVTAAGGVCDPATAVEVWGAPNPFHDSMPRLLLFRALAGLRSRGLQVVLVTNNIAEWRDVWRGLLPADAAFDHVVDSSAVGARKPEARLWRLVEDLTGALPEEVLLIDDRAETVDAAIAHGWHGIVFADEAACVASIVRAIGPEGGTVGAEEAVLAAAHAARRDERPVVVALDGRSASGKSTLGERLGEHADVALLHMDDFYRVAAPAERAAWTAEEGVSRYFDWQRLRDEALVPLRSGRPATFRVYDWDADDYGAEITVEPRPIVVVEGVYSARAELREFVDITVLVDTAPAVCLRRQRARNQSPGEQIRRWRAAEDVYFATFDSSAALVVSGEGKTC